LVASCGDASGPEGPGVTVTIVAAPAMARQGDVKRLAVEVRDESGALVDTVTVGWSVLPTRAGTVSRDGRFVVYAAGGVQVVVTAGTGAGAGADTAEIAVSLRGLSGGFTTIGTGALASRFTSDLWVQGTVAYTGTWGARASGAVPLRGNTVFTWDIGDPANPTLTDSVMVDAATVNDVKIRADGRLAVITHEGSADGQNGVTLLDLADPLHPTVIVRFTTTIERGVHNAWLEGDYVYVAAAGGDAASGLRILDVSDPQNPQVVSSFYGGSSFLHDVYVRDGLAFLSHWNAGLIILDVGNGMAGGSPENPVEVSRVRTAGGQTHNAWYWPAGGYVFVGEEDFQTPGVVHVIDVTDLARPAEVATFSVSRATPPHNFWLDEANGILYAAWYSEGIRALDVSGELLGELDRQGREIAARNYSGAGPCAADLGSATCTWAPQLDGGLVYLSDMNSGLWVLRPEF
jgi:hypothetical protein